MSLRSGPLSRGSHGLCNCVFIPLAAEPDFYFRIEIPLDVGHQAMDGVAACSSGKNCEEVAARRLQEEWLPEMAVDACQMDFGGSSLRDVATDT